jgi:hypothetical protein
MEGWTGQSAYFDVATATVDFLRVFDRELQDQVFAFVRERFGEFGGDGVETRVLTGLDTFVLIRIAVPATITQRRAVYAPDQHLC